MSDPALEPSRPRASTARSAGARTRGLRSGLLTVLLLGSSGPRSEAAAPYPASSVITGVTFDWLTHDERAPGSDNWPVTWSDDDHQYASWGDGGGFGGSNADGRVSLGVGRIEGPWPSYQGFNVWGGKDPENPAQFDGKSYGILSLGGDLFKWWGPGSGTTSYTETRLAHSTDKGATWVRSSWDFTDVDDRLVMPTILNFGKDYAGARDGFVYHYFVRREPTGPGLGIHKGGAPATGKIDLARVPQGQLLVQSAYEFFAGLNGSQEPAWTSNAAERQPVFEDPNGVGWNVSVSYNAPLGRYLLATEHTTSLEGQMGLFDAPEPWGPWTTVEYHEAPDYFGGNAGHTASTFFWNFANKWLSTDGGSFTLIFTGVGGDDSWNSIRGHFTTAGGGPTRTLTLLKDGSGSGDVTSSPAGIDCGSTCEAAFPVGTDVAMSPSPADGSAFTAWGGDSDCLDGEVHLAQARTCLAIFDLAPPGGGLVAYWAFDEGAGTTAADASGNGHEATLANFEIPGDWTQGALGPALSFGGDDEYVEAPDAAALDLAGNEFTLAAWIRPDSFGQNSQGRVIDHGGGSTGSGGWTLQLMNNATVSNGLALQINNAYVATSDPDAVTLGIWQHVAVTVTGGTASFYVGGESRGFGLGAPAPLERAAPLRIGMRATDLARDFDGVIDEVRVYSRALSAQEVSDLAAPCVQAQDLLVENQTVSGLALFEACNTITAGPALVLGPSAQVTFRARKLIALADGFQVEPGAIFAAELDPRAGETLPPTLDGDIRKVSGYVVR